ncbi:DnaA N-terminal domain-containing protein [Shimia thalassica]|uniref:DnaA N-terminal domain-containing protein n=1 Tax=Shimia thalassica TaxID=1715693 RepID=UPI0026E22990|nr:DnaA N-terminal domain-containing protein [Shimia thalassica]MDO6481886.1 DnaA N-terminal domain-containing protein [Shimia thalassica]
MIATKPVGQGASALKYDLLTAMGTLALSREKGQQRLVLRLMTLVTARYNWARNELAVGQREIARLWHVDERTVKREMAKLRTMQWLIVKRQGRRGRVTEYSLDITRILHDTRPHWEAIGPDFASRLSQDGTKTNDGKVVPLPVKVQVAAPDVQSGEEWVLAQALLHSENQAVYGSWFKSLVRAERTGGRLVLRAPSRFHADYVAAHHKDRMLAACKAVDQDVLDILVLPPTTP